MPQLRLIMPLVAAIAFGAMACEKTEVATTGPAPEVVVAPVEQKDVEIFTEWVGTTTGFVNAQIYPKIQGYLLKQAYKDGSVVAAGDLLFEIDAAAVPGRARSGEGPARRSAGGARQERARRRRATRRSPPRAPSASRSSTTRSRRAPRASAQVDSASGRAREGAAQPRVDEGAGSRSTASRRSPPRRSAISSARRRCSRRVSQLDPIKVDVPDQRASSTCASPKRIRDHEQTGAGADEPALS